jgi:hypothetical protein
MDNAPEVTYHQRCVDMIVAWKVPAALSSLMQQSVLRGSGMGCPGPEIIAACELDRLKSIEIIPLKMAYRGVIMMRIYGALTDLHIGDQRTGVKRVRLGVNCSTGDGELDWGSFLR